MKDIYIDFSKGSPHWRIFENCHFDMVRLAAVSHIDKYLERYPNAAKQLQSEDMDVPGYLLYYISTNTMQISQRMKYGNKFSRIF